MRIANGPSLDRGTDPDLVEVAVWRARFEVGRGLSKGDSPDDVRESVLRRFRLELQEESYGEYADELLMAAMQREIEAALRTVASG